MKKNAIWIIISLMGTALIGIIVIQSYWIQWSIGLTEQNFNSQVYAALNKVQDRLQKEAEKPLEAVSFFKKKRQSGDPSLVKIMNKDINSMISEYDQFTQQRLLFEINSLELGLNPTQLLESINPATLDTFLRSAFEDQNIPLKFDYGIFSNLSDDFFIVNGNYTALVDNSPKASMVETNLKLYDAHYKVKLFSNELESPGSLRIFFQNRSSLLWKSVWPALISSILFTSLILFCFSYVLYIVFRQKKVSEMKTDFINNMTHEFKTPIATISLAADSIKSPTITGNSDKVVRFANIIKEENKRMLSQVEKVLQMALIDKQDFDLKIATIDFHQIINTAAEHTLLKVKEKNGTVRTDLRAKKSKVEGDLTHLSNVIHNLLDNANKYTPENPDIVLSTEDAKNGIRVTVSDNGIGMSKESLKHIFDKFYRVHTGNLHDVKGFGLGLSYVKAIVTAHKGEIDVKSDLGKGSKFILFFPYKISD